MRLLWVEADPKQHEICIDAMRANGWMIENVEHLTEVEGRLGKENLALIVLAIEWDPDLARQASRLIQHYGNHTRFLIMLEGDSTLAGSTSETTIPWPNELLADLNSRFFAFDHRNESDNQRIQAVISEWVGESSESVATSTSTPKHIQQHAIDLTNQGILVVDAQQDDYPIVYCNAAFLKLTGYSEQEILGRNCRFLQGDDRNQESLEKIRKSLAAGEESKALLRNYRRDGSLFWNELHISPVRDASGTVTHFLGFQSDASQRVLAEMQLRERDGDGSRLGHLGSIDTIASALAHELTQPLGAAANYAGGCIDLLDTGLVKPVELTDKLNKLNDQIARSGDIIRRLRSYVSRSSPERTEEDVNGLIHEVVQMVSADAEASKVQIVLELQSVLPLIPCESTRIQQVFVNLIRNAMDALEEVPASDRSLTIHSTMNDDVPTFSLHDNGPGLTDEEKEKVFEPYFTTKSKGMGMGLGICRTIVTNHGGSIWVESKQGQGASFNFTLPIGRDSHTLPDEPTESKREMSGS